MQYNIQHWLFNTDFYSQFFNKVKRWMDYEL